MFGLFFFSLDYFMYMNFGFAHCIYVFTHFQLSSMKCLPNGKVDSLNDLWPIFVRFFKFHTSRKWQI